MKDVIDLFLFMGLPFFLLAGFFWVILKYVEWLHKNNKDFWNED